MDRKERLREALSTLKELAPAMHSVIERGFHVVNCDKQNDIERIESVVKMYLHAKNISLSPRVIDLLIWFVKHDTSTNSRKMISRKINMTGGTINQNASKLKKVGLLQYPYGDSKKSVIDPALIQLKNYMLDPKKGSSILVRFNG